MYEAADTMSPRTLAKAFVRLVTVTVILALLVGGSTVVLSVVAPSSLGFAFHAQLVDQGASPTLAPGETSLPLTVRFRNTGARTWTRGVAGQQVNLGVIADDKSMFALAAGWPSADRVATQTEPVVGPGSVATFTFRVKAPMTAGIFPLHLRLVADGVTWLEDEDVITLITVGATAGSPNKPITTGSPKFTVGATVEPATAVPGASVKLTATFTSSVASDPILGVEVYSPGGASLAFQKWIHSDSFAPGEQRTYPITWAVPAGASLGTYSVTVSAYSSGWKDLYGLKASAATFAVNVVVPPPSPTPAPTSVPTATPGPGATQTAAPTSTPTPAPTATAAPTPSFTATSSVAPTSVAQTSSLGITGLVTGASASSALVGIEVWAPGGVAAAYQVWFDNQSFAAGQQRSYSATWQVPASASLGSYTVKLGVFAPAWATSYTWAAPTAF